MNKVGWKLKLVTAWQRMVASYLRAVVVALSAVAITSSGLSMSLADIGCSLLAALIGPFLVFITETADIIDPTPDAPVNEPHDQQ